MMTTFEESIAPVVARHRGLLYEAACWGEQRDLYVEPELYALVQAAAGEPGPRLCWSRVEVMELLLHEVPVWYFQQAGSGLWPLEVVPATWWWLEFLHDTRRIDPRSDPLWELRKPLICYGGLGFDGRWRPDDQPSPIPCECLLPYRETAEHLNRRIDAGECIDDVLRPNQPDGGARAATLGRRWMSAPPPNGPPGRPLPRTPRPPTR